MTQPQDYLKALGDRGIETVGNDSFALRLSEGVNFTTMMGEPSAKSVLEAICLEQLRVPQKSAAHEPDAAILPETPKFPGLK